VLLLLAATATAEAEEGLRSGPGTDLRLETSLKLRRMGPSLSQRMRANLSEISTELVNNLGELALGLLDTKIDILGKRASVGLGGGDPEAFRLRIDSDVLFKGKRARINARVDVAVAGKRFEFDLPEFDMSSSKVAGQQAIQVSLPLLQTRF
jgi:hypothetical protein